MVASARMATEQHPTPPTICHPHPPMHQESVCAARPAAGGSRHLLWRADRLRLDAGGCTGSGLGQHAAAGGRRLALLARLEPVRRERLPALQHPVGSHARPGAGVGVGWVGHRLLAVALPVYCVGAVSVPHHTPTTHTCPQLGKLLTLYFIVAFGSSMDIAAIQVRGLGWGCAACWSGLGWHHASRPGRLCESTTRLFWPNPSAHPCPPMPCRRTPPATSTTTRSWSQWVSAGQVSPILPLGSLFCATAFS